MPEIARKIENIPWLKGALKANIDSQLLFTVKRDMKICADQDKEKAKLSEGESSTKKTDSNQKPEKGNDVTDKDAAASAAIGTDDEVGQQEQVTESKSSTLEGQLLSLQYTGFVKKVGLYYDERCNL